MPGTGTALVECRDLSFGYGARPILDGVTFTVPRVPNADDAEISGQVSTTLTNWTAADLTGSTSESLTFRVPAALAAEAKVFLRGSVRLR